MGRLARKKQHKGDKPLKEKYRTKRKTKDLDEIHDDMKPEKSQKLLKQDVDFDKPGAGQFYCLHCAKYFINETSLKTHFKSKPHKRRLKALSTEPYTVEEAERAAGMGSYKPPSKVTVETQSTNMDTDDT
uniref:Zinc finger protein 593-like n=1 Tax=Crassostrea virginica TaxID=6565 RepID=A0A8B8AGT0_CRAVI|nr:zinc finger protein 593-like [Crassostrea virginica]XP_022289200.1 zinc finger protein 593-like [Crassostrea virginica]XP_022289643.1 zinc finger protein 593-like [Crassostrea virginica]|mmetsp:Transcript_12525/g.22708  ORF Transcript_12525/g.22708 Transcript_12525/m.22708 type:complete len:130 (+) Transcript_12525:64-453(+)